MDQDTTAQVSKDTYPLAWTSNGDSLLMSDLPAAGDPSPALPLGGLEVGPDLSALSPVTPEGTVTPMALNMAVFFGLVGGD